MPPSVRSAPCCSGTAPPHRPRIPLRTTASRFPPVPHEHDPPLPVQCPAVWITCVPPRLHPPQNLQYLRQTLHPRTVRVQTLSSTGRQSPLPLSSHVPPHGPVPPLPLPHRFFRPRFLLRNLPQSPDLPHGHRCSVMPPKPYPSAQPQILLQHRCFRSCRPHILLQSLSRLRVLSRQSVRAFQHTDQTLPVLPPVRSPCFSAHPESLSGIP